METTNKNTQTKLIKAYTFYNIKIVLPKLSCLVFAFILVQEKA